MGRSKSANRRRIKRIAKAQGGICAICGKEIEELWKSSPDHIIPKSMGGPNSAWNLRATHRECNNRRGNAAPSGVDIAASLAASCLVYAPPLPTQ